MFNCRARTTMSGSAPPRHQPEEQQPLVGAPDRPSSPVTLAISIPAAPRSCSCRPAGSASGGGCHRDPPTPGSCGEDVHRVPGQLLRDEGVAACQPGDLRQTGGTSRTCPAARRCRRSGRRCPAATSARAGTAGRRTPRRHVPVRLDPGAPEQQPSALRDPLADPLEHLGLVLRHPRQVLHLG